MSLGFFVYDIIFVNECSVLSVTILYFVDECLFVKQEVLSTNVHL